jgi:hypothetical protein
MECVKIDFSRRGILRHRPGRSGRAAIHGRVRWELKATGLSPPLALKGKSFLMRVRGSKEPLFHATPSPLEYPYIPCSRIFAFPVYLHAAGEGEHSRWY